MTFKTVTCAIVMGSALMFGGAAYADTMVGSSTVTDADLPAVQARCDQLMTTADSTSLTENTDDDTAAGSNDGAADATANATTAVDETQAATTTSIDLDTVTLEQCKAAGLSK
ncbi:MAG: hypothetical protein JWR51_761 [Devosia sp.]|uniref:hypothetical protein n=1 Tax=Devosia sp. TaxID=1871048 RepID=UPI00263720C0|nr:hypothetical protein [Devosia sp.]MDB5527658.1 hypothetical protein [Devosia sp.]